MAQEHLLAHPLGAGAVARVNGPDFLAWDLAPDTGPWLYHAPLLFSLLHQREPANVLAICNAESGLPDLLRSLPGPLAETTSIATVQLDPPADTDAGADAGVLVKRLVARLADYPDGIFNLVLIDLPLSEDLKAAIQGQPLARVSQPGAVVGLHGADRTAAGAQLATQIRLTRRHLANADGEGLIVFSTEDDHDPIHALGGRLNMLRTLGRAYSGVAQERRKGQAEADRHAAELADLRQRQSLLEDTNKAQIGQLLEQSARLSDASRAIAALPVEADPDSLDAARAAITRLRNKDAGGIDVPAGLVRLLDLIDALGRQMEETRLHQTETVKDGQAIVATLRIKEAELLKSDHAIGRMTQELAGLAVVLDGANTELAALRKIARRKTELEAENHKLHKKLRDALTREGRLKQQVDDLLNSTSWRISSPVRAVGKILRRR